MLIPGSAEAFGAHTALGRLVAQEIEGEVSQDGEVLSGMARPHTAVVFAEGDVQDPVQLVLNAPMAACGVQYLGRQVWRLCRQAAEIVAILG